MNYLNLPDPLNLKKMVESKLHLLNYHNIKQEPQAFWMAQSLIENITSYHKNNFTDLSSTRKFEHSINKQASHGDLNQVIKSFRSSRRELQVQDSKIEYPNKVYEEMRYQRKMDKSKSQEKLIHLVNKKPVEYQDETVKKKSDLINIMNQPNSMDYGELSYRHVIDSNRHKRVQCNYQERSSEKRSVSRKLVVDLDREISTISMSSFSPNKSSLNKNNISHVEIKLMEKISPSIDSIRENIKEGNYQNNDTIHCKITINESDQRNTQRNLSRSLNRSRSQKIETKRTDNYNKDRDKKLDSGTEKYARRS